MTDIATTRALDAAAQALANVGECVHTITIKGHIKDDCCAVIEPAIVAFGSPAQFAQCFHPKGHAGHHVTPNGSRMFPPRNYRPATAKES